MITGQPPSAEQYYAQAIQTMRNLPQPDFATYNVHVHVTGLTFVYEHFAFPATLAEDVFPAT